MWLRWGVVEVGPSGPVDCMAYTHSTMPARSALVSLGTASASGAVSVCEYGWRVVGCRSQKVEWEVSGPSGGRGVSMRGLRV